jgi:hypothetical protein
MNTPFATKIEQLGYFKGLPADKAQALKQEFERKGWLGIFGDSHRLFMADAEDLAEGGVGQFLREVAPFLAAQGVKLPTIEEDTSEDGYVVRVGGVAHQMYDAADLERDSSGEEGGLIWGLSAVRGLRIVDQLLAAAGSAERAYAINGGNDLFVLFLTPELHRVIMEQPDASRHDGPYLPKEEYPSFGQPDDE